MKYEITGLTPSCEVSPRLGLGLNLEKILFYRAPVWARHVPTFFHPYSLSLRPRELTSFTLQTYESQTILSSSIGTNGMKLREIDILPARRCALYGDS